MSFRNRQTFEDPPLILVVVGGLAIRSPLSTFLALGSYVSPLSFHLVHLSCTVSLLDQRVREEIAPTLLPEEVKSGVRSLGKPELRPLQQGFFEMLHLPCTPFLVFKGQVTLEEVEQDFALREAEGRVFWTCFVVEEFTGQTQPLPSL